MSPYRTLGTPAPPRTIPWHQKYDVRLKDNIPDSHLTLCVMIVMFWWEMACIVCLRWEKHKEVFVDGFTGTLTVVAALTLVVIFSMFEISRKD